MPTEGWIPTMVPGAPAGWAELNRRFGTKPLTELFAPAIAYARQGVPVPGNVARQWAKDAPRIKAAMERDPAPHACWWSSFMKEDGSPYQAGDLFRWEACAATLEELAELEHLRWWRFHTLSGWQYGVPEHGNRDAEKKYHTCLRPYEDLEPEEKEKDRAVVRRVLHHVS